MSRPARAQTLMSSAYLWARRSTCSRLNVGCVIEREGRILVQGYNGAPAGLPHCNHECNCTSLLSRGGERYVMPPGEHAPMCASQIPCKRAVHAEQNAISFAARWGVGLEGATAWVTHQPCLSCAMSIINAGIVAVNYQERYRIREGTDLLTEAGVTVNGGLWSRAKI